MKKSILLLLCLSLIAVACGGSDEEVEKITFGFVPSAEQTDLQDNIQPLMDVLSEGLGIEVEGFVTSDYSGLIVAMGSGQADIGAFNTLGYVNAMNAYPDSLEAIAKVVRYGSGSYHGTFYTNDASICNEPPVIGALENIDGSATLVKGSTDNAPDVKALQVGWVFGDSGLEPDPDHDAGVACEADLSVMLGKTVAFVEEGSTSGYLFPAIQLKNAGIDYQSDFNVIFAGSHDASVLAVYNGDADFGIAFDDARRSIRKEYPDVGSKVIAFSITEEIPNDVVAVRSNLPEDIKEKIYQILSDYLATDEGLAVMDEIYGWTDIVPAVNAEFDIVKQAAEEFGLYDE